MVFNPKDLIQGGTIDKDLGFGDEDELAPIGNDTTLQDVPFEVPNDILDISRSKSNDEGGATLVTSPLPQPDDPFNM